jgi:hypothetical protein
VSVEEPPPDISARDMVSLSEVDGTLRAVILRVVPSASELRLFKSPVHERRSCLVVLFSRGSRERRRPCSKSETILSGSPSLRFSVTLIVTATVCVT